METEIFTCRYFKFGRNTTGLSQSHWRNFLACSINPLIIGDQPYVAAGVKSMSKVARDELASEQAGEAHQVYASLADSRFVRRRLCSCHH